MNKPFLTTMGLYRTDPTLFDGFQVPAGLDKNIAIDRIIMVTSGLELMWPDLDMMRHLITSWSSSHQWSWTKLYKTMLLEYNPIWNYDRTETSTDTDTRNRKELENTTAIKDFNGQVKRVATEIGNQGSTAHMNEVVESDSEGSATENGDEEHKVSAYNSEQYEPKDMATRLTTTDTTGHTDSDTTGSESRHVDTTINNNDTADTTNKTVDDVSRDIKEGEEQSHQHNLRAYGNIGVTTTQQMIDQERASVMFDIYQVICDSYKQTFCLLVY